MFGFLDPYSSAADDLGTQFGLPTGSSAKGFTLPSGVTDTLNSASTFASAKPGAQKWQAGLNLANTASQALGGPSLFGGASGLGSLGGAASGAAGAAGAAAPAAAAAAPAAAGAAGAAGGGSGCGSLLGMALAAL